MKRLLQLFIMPLLAGALAAGAVQSLFSAYAVQNEMVPPTAGVYTGVQYSQKIGDAFKSIASGNKGSSAPANVGGATVDGLRWVDDTTSLWIKKTYVNGAWATEGAYNAGDSTWLGVIGGGVPASISSNATVDLGSVPQANVLIQGTVTVTGFGASAPAGIIKLIRFDSALKLAASGSLKIPCGFDLMTAANDRAMVTHLGSGNWEVTQYTRDSGIPIDCSAVGKVDYTFAGAVPPLHVMGDGSALTRTSYPAYLAKVTIAQNGTRTSGNATITGIANTARMGAGMPVEATGINANCIIASVVPNTSITLNSSSCVTASGTSTVTVFLTGYGTGGSASTVGVKDCTGRAMAGRESTATHLAASYFNADSTVMGSAGGSDHHLLALGEAPTGITSANTGLISLLVTSNSNQVKTGPYVSTGFFGGSGGSVFYNDATSSFGSINSTGSIGIGVANVTSNNTGGNPHSIVSPMLIADCVVRVTP